MSVHEPVEKKPLQSKKFVAFVFSSLIWVGLMTGALFTMKDTAGFSTTLMAMVICLGFLQTLYIGGQSAVDTFVRIGVAFAQKTAVPQSALPDFTPRRRDDYDDSPPHEHSSTIDPHEMGDDAIDLFHEPDTEPNLGPGTI